MDPDEINRRAREKQAANLARAAEEQTAADQTAAELARIEANAEAISGLCRQFYRWANTNHIPTNWISQKGRLSKKKGWILGYNRRETDRNPDIRVLAVTTQGQVLSEFAFEGGSHETRWEDKDIAQAVSCFTPETVAEKIAEFVSESGIPFS